MINHCSHQLKAVKYKRTEIGSELAAIKATHKKIWARVENTLHCWTAQKSIDIMQCFIDLKRNSEEKLKWHNDEFNEKQNRKLYWGSDKAIVKMKHAGMKNGRKTQSKRRQKFWENLRYIWCLSVNCNHIEEKIFLPYEDEKKRFSLSIWVFDEIKFQVYLCLVHH